ncbi:MAG: RbsD/FucU domain-containing protein [Bacteroidota bacterium]
MKKILFIFICMMLMLSCTAPKQEKQIAENRSNLPNWKLELEQTLKLFGHRNWIVIADAAYPKQSNPAIQTTTIDATQLEAVRFVNQLIENSSHVDANIFIDKEMAFVPEKNAKGIESYRAALDQILAGKDVTTMLHEDIISELDASAELFNVLIIKTGLSLPYTSVFFQLECGYWNNDAEKRLRDVMLKKQNKHD